jgi:hypothetical protein
MKPTYILIVKTESDGDYMAINTQDLKTVRVNPEKETAVVVTSSAKTTLACMTKHRLERFLKELNDRYNILNLPSLQYKGTSHDNTILAVERDGVKTYIWPKALFSVQRRGNKVTIKAFGDMTIELSDPERRIGPELFTRFDGLVLVSSQPPVAPAGQTTT